MKVNCKKKDCFANIDGKYCGCLQELAVHSDGSCAFYKEKTPAFNKRTIEKDIEVYAEKCRG